MAGIMDLWDRSGTALPGPDYAPTGAGGVLDDPRVKDLLAQLGQPSTIPVPDQPKPWQVALAALGTILGAKAGMRGGAPPPMSNPAIEELLRRRRERKSIQGRNVLMRDEAAKRAAGAELNLRVGEAEAKAAAATRAQEKTTQLAEKQMELSAHDKLTRDMTELVQDAETKRSERENQMRREIASQSSEDRRVAQASRQEDISTQDKKNFALAMDELSAIVHGTGNKDSLTELIKGGRFTPEQAAGIIAAKARRNAILLPPEMAKAYAEEVKKLTAPVLEQFDPSRQPQGPEQPPEQSALAKKAKSIFDAVVYGK